MADAPSGASPLQAVTFDFYDTLVFHRVGRGRGHVLMEYLDGQSFRHAPWEHRVLYDIFDGQHARYSPHASKAERAAQQVDIARRAFRRLEVAASDEEVARHAPALWAILGPGSFAVYPDVQRVLQAVRDRGMPTALISNWQCGLTQFCVELRLNAYFDHILCSDELGVAKPDPHIFLDACGRLGLPPDHVVHVGDSVTDDYDGAEGAGLGAVLLCRTADAEPVGRRWIRRLDELPRVLTLDGVPGSQ